MPVTGWSAAERRGCCKARRPSPPGRRGRGVHGLVPACPNGVSPQRVHSDHNDIRGLLAAAAQLSDMAPTPGGEAHRACTSAAIYAGSARPWPSTAIPATGKAREGGGQPEPGHAARQPEAAYVQCRSEVLEINRGWVKRRLRPQEQQEREQRRQEHSILRSRPAPGDPVQVALRRCGRAPQGETEQPPHRSKSSPSTTTAYTAASARPARRTRSPARSRLASIVPAHRPPATEISRPRQANPRTKFRRCAISTLLQTLVREGGCLPVNPIGTQ